MAVLGEQPVDGLAIEIAGRGILAEIGNVVPALLEVLVAGRALLAVPARLVDSDGRGEDRQTLDGEGDVRQIRDAAMAVLEVEGVEEFLRLLLVDLGQRLAHGQRRAGILGHAVGLDFGIGAMDGVNVGAGLVIRAGLGTVGVWFVTCGHWAESYAVRIPGATGQPVKNSRPCSRSQKRGCRGR